MNTDDQDDSHVAALLHRGELRDAIAFVARAHGPTVRRVCTALTGRPDLAADIAQDTFVAAATALPNWRGEGSIRAFLCGIARKLCANNRMRTARQQARLHLVVGTDASPDATLALEAAQRAKAARAALSCLSPGDQEILILRYEGDLTYAEIGTLLSIDEPTARKRSSRALLRMREALPLEVP